MKSTAPAHGPAWRLVGTYNTKSFTRSTCQRPSCNLGKQPFCYICQSFPKRQALVCRHKELCRHFLTRVLFQGGKKKRPNEMLVFCLFLFLFFRQWNQMLSLWQETQYHFCTDELGEQSQSHLAPSGQVLS